MKKTYLIYSLIFVFLLSFNTEAEKSTSLFDSTSHLNFAKWNRDPNTCCEATGNKIAIASGGIESSKNGIKISETGGNIVDVATTVALCLNVERAHSTSLAGGGFMLLHLAKGKRKDHFVDFRETAPKKANAKIFLDAKGEPIPRATLDGAKAVATPGMVAGLYEIHKKWGKLPWAKVVEPCAKLAKEGVPLSVATAERIEKRRAYLEKDAYVKSLLFNEKGEPKKAGDKFIQADLGKTLDIIAQKGRDGFYKGEVADAIVKTVQTQGGVLDKSDLLGYKVQFTEPLETKYKQWSVLTSPPPSAGGVILIQALNIMESWDLPRLYENPDKYIHFMAEVFKRGYADRSNNIGDPNSLKGKEATRYRKLLTKAYIDEIRKKISLEKATPSAEIKPFDPNQKNTHGTTHISILDDEGNAVSMTITLNVGNFGSGIAVPGYGMFLNNEMDDFTLIAGRKNEYGLVSSEINSIKGGRRPVSSMMPTVVLENGRPVLAIGAAGGSKIISATTQAILSQLVLAPGNLRKAVYAPRLHHQWMPDEIELEGDLLATYKEPLTKLGQRVKENSWTADIEAAAYDPQTKQFKAVIDPRNQGGAAAK